MKRCYLDSNILINFVDQEAQFFEQSNQLLQSLSLKGFSFTFSPLVIDEFLYQIKYYLIQKYKQNQIWLPLQKMLEKVLSLPDLEIINPSFEVTEQLQVLRLMKQYNLSPRDAYHLFTVLSNDVGYIASFDQDFTKVKEVEVVGVGGS